MGRLRGRRLKARQSVWHTHTTLPKTQSSLKPVPVIEPLRTILTELRQSEGNPMSGTILRGESGKPLNLDNLARRVVIPTLKAAGIIWQGWYSLRRGIGTLTSTIAHDPQAAKGMLRHSNLSTTMTHYIKDVPEVTEQAMLAVEKLCSDCAVKQAGANQPVVQVQ
ncbi:MAG TPA: hypothetical protein VK639_07145 [Terriglobales bacterium]|nr:hypothetical protein [Terriglobales bacterium]